MEKTQRVLEIQRVAFQRIYQDIQKELQSFEPDFSDIHGNLKVLDTKMDDISLLSKQLLDLLLEADCTEEEIDSEVTKADETASLYNKLKYKVEQHSVKKLHHESIHPSSESGHSSDAKSKMKLPRIELKKFSGDIKEWITFWSQFKRIHENDDIEKEDKFQYLIQSTITKSRARQLVESYPPSADNYDKVIDSLKSRFGKEELLVEFYVRELLKLVLSNLKVKSSISTLYDNLECQLQSLETLGVTSEKYAAMLFPLVESCLPEDLLRVWQRSQTTVNSDLEISTPRSYDATNCRLKRLMEFLKKEVEDEEKITMATSFEFNPKKNESSRDTSVIPSASNLLNHQKSLRCIFCSNNHSSGDCIVAQKMNISERRKISSSKGCCYICLKFGHIARRCKVNVECKECKKRHVTLMCPMKDSPSNETKFDDSKKDKGNMIVENLSNHTYNQVFLQTFLVELYSDNCNRKVRAIIDTGSQRSYINRCAATEMGYEPLGHETMVHALFGGSQSEIVNHTLYRISLRNLNQRYACSLQTLDQPIICNNVAFVSDGPWMLELEEFGIEISDKGDGPIEVLIGADIAGKLFTGKKHILKCGLVAIETLLGWTIMGKVVTTGLNIRETIPMTISSLFCKSHQISDLWSLDTLGITDPNDKHSKDEMEAAVLQHFQKTVSINEKGRYEVVMPWIEGHPPLPTNFNLARRRLDSLLDKLKKDGYHDEYEKVFSEWLAEGIIENVPESEVANESHYLPHRHIVKLSSATTKIRPVFDASAREKGYPSLNQCLEKGINLIELIPSILLRFRLCKIGVISDIRKAFLQISLAKSDRDTLRFIWIDKDGTLIHLRHARVVFGVTSSPFLLGAVIQHHLSTLLKKCQTEETHFSESIIQKLLKCFYVDNCVVSLNSEEELREFIDESIQIMNEGKFDLRCWEHTILDTNLTDTFVSQVLGLRWNRLQDTLEICFEWFQDLNLDKITKRTILSAVSKIFDPIGFTSPVSMFAKVLLQNMWILKIGWDAEVPEDIKKRFLNWIQELGILINLRIPRWLSKSSELSSRSVHMFSDASQNAYAAVVFLRTEDTKGTAHVQLIQAKTRVSPIKKLSIPRLELMAATIGVRLLTSILSTLEGDIAVYCWTDSSTVLAWINQEDQWKTFVWNRIQEIHRMTRKEDWYFIPGHLNPADLPSRGCSSKQLLESKWWEGPFWLSQGRSEWPDQEYLPDDSIIMEERSRCLITSCLDTRTDTSSFYRYFSKYKQIVNLVGWIRRFANNCLQKIENRNLERTLTLEEIQDAEKKLLILIQQESFASIKDKSLTSLCPYVDEDGLYRLKTKISARDDLYDFRHPVILPPNHPVVIRMIHECHVINCHVGTQGLLNHMREKFWIIKGRKSIRSVISKCSRCRRYNSKNFESIPIELPENRVRDAAVFEVIGVDLAGPLFIRNNEKVWICIFTCAVYRAVHLELVSSLSSDSFLQALRRFIGRRGRPAIVYSDNGMNFVGADNAFEKIDWNEIVKYSTTQRFIWKFSPPTGAWWGGWWERLIRILKELLRKTLGRTSLNYEELSTTLCECEAVMNSRPLTYVSDDIQDLVPLTPSMFLQDLREVGVPDIDIVDTESVNRHLRYRIKLTKDLRKRFRKEYLGQLMMRPKKNISNQIKVGDVVLVEKDSTKRLDWPLALVVEICPGKDGKVRVVRLKTSSGFITRPIQRLFPLELNAEEETAHNLRSSMKKRQEDENKSKKKRNSDEDTQEEEENKIHKPVTITRFGRMVKAPERFQM